MIDKKAILDFLGELEKEFPYKVPKQPDTYCKYNEAWQDCISRIEAFISTQPNSEHLAEHKGDYRHCEECGNWMPLPDGTRGGKRGRCKRRRSIHVRNGRARACKLFIEVTERPLLVARNEPLG